MLWIYIKVDQRDVTKLLRVLTIIDPNEQPA
jgi:hypothetical protein